MDKMFIRKDVYEEILEKGYGKRDLSKLTKKQITDKNGHKRTVYVRNGEQPTEVKQPKAQEGLTPEKKAKYEEMLEKVKAGSDENALIVRGKTLNKKDAIAHLEGKLGNREVVEKIQNTRNQKLEKEKADANKNARDFYDRTGLKGGMYEALARNEADKEDRKQENLKAGNRDDSMFEENDKIEFSRYGKFINGSIKQVKKDYKGNVTLLVHGEDDKDYWIDTEDVTKHKGSEEAKKKTSKELKKEIEDLRSEYREKYDSLSKDEINKYVKKLDELESEIDKNETEETGMNKFERRGYEDVKNNPWLDKTKLPQIKENTESKIRGYENLLNDLKNDKSKKSPVERESHEVNLAIAQNNLDEFKGKLKAINEIMGKK